MTMHCPCPCPPFSSSLSSLGAQLSEFGRELSPFISLVLSYTSLASPLFPLSPFLLPHSLKQASGSPPHPSPHAPSSQEALPVHASLLYRPSARGVHERGSAKAAKKRACEMRRWGNVSSRAQGKGEGRTHVEDLGGLFELPTEGRRTPPTRTVVVNGER